MLVVWFYYEIQGSSYLCINWTLFELTKSITMYPHTDTYKQMKHACPLACRRSSISDTKAIMLYLEKSDESICESYNELRHSILANGFTNQNCVDTS